MNRAASPGRTVALAGMVMFLAAGLASAQIPYYYNPTAGMAPGPNQASAPKATARAEPNRSLAPSAVAGAGLMTGEIMPFILQNDTLSSLPIFVSAPQPDYRARVWLRVPPAAQVWFNGSRTSQAGEVRHYTSPPLSPGKTYSYKVRVRWMNGGKSIERERRIEVQAGGLAGGDFLASEASLSSSAGNP